MIDIRKFERESELADVRGIALRAGWIATTLLTLAGVAQAQMTPSNKTGPDVKNDSLTWNGITLYGLIDIGLQYDTHSAPFSDYHPAGSSNIVQKYSRQSAFGATPSNMGQSRIGLQGDEPIVGDWSAVFRVETFFNPQSGEISDAEKSMVLNNGKSAAQQGVNLDSSVAGQAFETLYAGVSSKTYGSFTFGRQLTLLGDGINKYDPNYGSQAFSLIGMSGTYAGGGDTEDKRVDNSLKYYGTYMGLVHFGAMYKFNNSNGGANSLTQADIGAEYAGASLDAYYAKAKSAISLSPLSATQVGELPTLGYAISNSLSGTISDNTTFSVMGFYKFDPFKFLFGYEHIKYANPANPLSAGFIDIGGYNVAFVNNNAFPNAKVLDVYWAGVRYTVIPHLDLTGAYYGYHQNAYGTGANAGCSTNVSGTCSGDYIDFSFDADYQLTKRFDVYAGAMYSGVRGGAANGYLYERTNINPTIGVRFKF